MMKYSNSNRLVATLFAASLIYSSQSPAGDIISASEACSATRVKAMRKAAEDGAAEIEKVNNPSLDFLKKCLGNINRPSGFSLGVPDIMKALENAACNFAQETVGAGINKLSGAMNYSWSGYGISAQSRSSSTNSVDAASQIWQNMKVQPNTSKNTIGNSNY